MWKNQTINMTEDAIPQLRVLMLTSEWPTSEHPEWTPFLVHQVWRLREAGIEIIVFPFRGNKKPLNYLTAWWKLRQQQDIKKFDLIHAQFGQSGLLALPKRIPLVVTFHGSDLLGDVGADGRYTARGKLLQLLSRFIAGIADQNILVAGHLANCLPPKIPYHVIPCGIDFGLFRPTPQEQARRQLGLPLHKPLVLFVANPDNPIKRYRLAQEAVNLLKGKIEVELLTVCGVPHDLIPVFMNAGDALLLTSTHEGSPNVVKEALACNLPVVSVDVGDVRERIAGIEGCVLCEDYSPETIATGLAQVLQDHEHIQGREAIADLDERLVARRIVEVYKTVLSKSHDSSK